MSKAFGSATKNPIPFFEPTETTELLPSNNKMGEPEPERNRKKTAKQKDLDESKKQGQIYDINSSSISTLNKEPLVAWIMHRKPNDYEYGSLMTKKKPELRLIAESINNK